MRLRRTLRYLWTFLHPHQWRVTDNVLGYYGMGTERFNLYECRWCDARASGLVPHYGADRPRWFQGEPAFSSFRIDSRGKSA